MTRHQSHEEYGNEGHQHGVGGPGQREYHRGYRWNPNRGVVANLFGLGLSAVPGFFGALGDFANDLRGAKKELGDYDLTRRNLKEGVFKHAKRLEELTEAGIDLKDNPDARVAHFGKYFELGLRPTTDSKGRPVTVGFIVLKDDGRTGVYGYSHPGFFADIGYFKEPKPRKADNSISRSALNAQDVSDDSDNGVKGSKFYQRCKRLYDAAKFVTKKGVDIAKDIHAEVGDVETFIGNPAKMQEKLNNRAKEINDRGGRIRDWTEHCEVREFGPFVEFEVPILTEGLTHLRDTYMINLITGEVKSRYPAVKKTYSGSSQSEPVGST